MFGPWSWPESEVKIHTHWKSLTLSLSWNLVLIRRSYFFWSPAVFHSIHSMPSSQDLQSSQPTPEADSTTPTPQSKSKSYFWTYFIKVNSDQLKCNFVRPNGEPCNKTPARDAPGSTKGMRSHLSSQHGVKDPQESLSNQSRITALFKKKKLEHVVCNMSPLMWLEVADFFIFNCRIL